MILTLPLLREIRNSYKGATTVLWGILPQAKLATPSFVDRVERLDSAELAPIFGTAQMPAPVRGRLEGFDLAISLLSDPDMAISQNLVAAEVKRVVAGSCQVRSGVHAVYQLAAVLDQLGLILHDPVPRLSVGPNPQRSWCFGFHLGSGSIAKNWPMDCWIELTERLDGWFDNFLLVGGEADNELVREFCSRCHVRRLRRLLNASLSELSLALHECRLFVGHDTGVTHLAAAVGTPTIALFGPTDPSVWAPLGAHVTVVRSSDGLMGSISAAAVVALAAEVRGER